MMMMSLRQFQLSKQVELSLSSRAKKERDLQTPADLSAAKSRFFWLFSRRSDSLPNGALFKLDFGSK